MLAPMLLCAAITFAVLLALKWHAPRLGLVDHPVGHRTHDAPTPVIGGIGMAAGLFLTWFVSDAIKPGTAFALGAAGLVAVGVWDDRHGMRARRKFAAQALIVATALAFDGDLLHTLGELLPGLDVRMSILALPFTVFAVLGLINAVNMMDGLDGLAGKVVLVAFGWLATCMALIGGWTRMTSILAIVGAISVFLLFNARVPGRARAHLFMGDTGSMLLGYLLAWAAIDATQRKVAVPPITVLWICALPILDTLSVAAERILDGRSPLAAGRDHLHHLLRARGRSVAAVALTEAGIGAALGLVCVAGWRLGIPEWLMFTLFLMTGMAYHQAFRIAWQSTRSRAAATDPMVPPARPTGRAAAAAAIAAEPRARPVAEPIARSVVEPRARPLAEPIARSVAEPRARPLAEPVVESRPEAAPAESSV